MNAGCVGEPGLFETLPYGSIALILCVFMVPRPPLNDGFKVGLMSGSPGIGGPCPQTPGSKWIHLGISRELEIPIIPQMNFIVARLGSKRIPI